MLCPALCVLHHGDVPVPVPVPVSVWRCVWCCVPCIGASPFSPTQEEDEENDDFDGFQSFDPTLVVEGEAGEHALMPGFEMFSLDDAEAATVTLTTKPRRKYVRALSAIKLYFGRYFDCMHWHPQGQLRHQQIHYHTRANHVWLATALFFGRVCVCVFLCVALPR